MVRAIILGSGCTKCRILESNIKQAAQTSGKELELKKSRNPADYSKYGVSMPPALVINDELIPASDALSVQKLTEKLQAV